MTDINEQLREWARKGGSTKTEKTKLRGFASMTPERRREIAQKGAKSSNAKQGRGHDSKQER